MRIEIRPPRGARARGAMARGDDLVTLTTFRDVPWNAPYYERIGYRALREDEIGPELRALMAREADHGLDPALRVAMAVDLGKDRRP